MTVFTQNACAPCKKLKYLLDKRGIKYEEKPLEEHMEEVLSKGFMAAPVVQIGERWFSGADTSTVFSYLDTI